MQKAHTVLQNTIDCWFFVHQVMKSLKSSPVPNELHSPLHIFKVDKVGKLNQSQHIIAFMELIPQPYKGFGKECLSCQCISAALLQHHSHRKSIQNYFTNLAIELWTQDHESNGLLTAFAELISPFCTNVSLKCPMFKLYCLHFVCIVKKGGTVCKKSIPEKQSW